MNAQNTFQVSIIGAGKLGGALAIALGRKGCEIRYLIARNAAKASAIAHHLRPAPAISTLAEFEPGREEILIIATQDAEIENAVKILAEKSLAENFVFHTSGALSSEILRPLQAKGCRTGSLHPLVSVSDPVLGAERFAGAYFCVEGDRRAIEAAEALVEHLEGRSFSIETGYKPLYHAAAVTACGHLVALIDVALEMLQTCGLSAESAQKTMLPLIKSTIENLETQSPAEALTGTFARADVKTFERHLKALNDHAAPEIREVYLQLGARSAQLAQKRGANRENLEDILRQISLAKKNLRC